MPQASASAALLPHGTVLDDFWSWGRALGLAAAIAHQTCSLRPYDFKQKAAAFLLINVAVHTAAHTVLLLLLLQALSGVLMGQRAQGGRRGHAGG